MKIYSTYRVKIKHYNHIFKDTVSIYHKAVDFLINVCICEWNNISTIRGDLLQQQYVEKCVHATKDNPAPVYDFDTKFYKMPSYMRRGAINEASRTILLAKSHHIQKQDMYFLQCIAL